MRGLMNHRELERKSMTRCDDFEKKLRGHMHVHQLNGQIFPFLCNGHPISAKLVLIGFNPSTGGGPIFNRFWRPKTGFHLGRYQAYRKQETRKQKANRQSGTRPKRSTSRTRTKILDLVKAVGVDVFLSTNVYWAASPRAKCLQKQHRNPAPLDWLLRTIEDPKCHRRYAQ